MQTIDDPFGSLARVNGDRTGVRIWQKDRTAPGAILFHTNVGNKIVVIRYDGTVLMEFSTPPAGYQLYRPGKAAADSRVIYCILKSNNRFEDRAIAALAEDGEVIWKTSPHHFTHDFQVTEERKIFSVLRNDRDLGEHRISDNIICEMDLVGNISWQWSVLDNLHKFAIGGNIIERTARYKNDNPFHVNSIQLVNDAMSMKNFGEASLVASARNMNSVFIVGLRSKNVLFEFSGQTVGQHHARLLRDVYPGAGNLLIVDNGLNFLPPYAGQSRGYSRVIEVSVPNGEIQWEYRSAPHQPLFFSPIVGAQQRLENGNTLITEGYYGRIFEVDRDSNIVWDYIHPERIDVETHLKSHCLKDTGLRQIYRAYKVENDWVNSIKKSCRYMEPAA